MSSSTGAAVLPPRAGEVAAAVANHGRAVSCEPRPYQFAIFPFFKPLSRLWIDAFYEEGISPCMHTITGHAWSKKLGHAKLIVGGNVEEFLQLQARLPRPGFRAEQADFELGILEIDTALTRFATNVETNRWSHTHGSHTEINDEVNHAVILARI